MTPGRPRLGAKTEHSSNCSGMGGQYTLEVGVWLRLAVWATFSPACNGVSLPRQECASWLLVGQRGREGWDGAGCMLLHQRAPKLSRAKVLF